MTVAQLLQNRNPMNILVPVDFSEMAAEAVNYASMLARKLDASVILLHALPPKDMWWTSSENRVLDDVRQKQELLIQKLLADGLDKSRIETYIAGNFSVSQFINDLIAYHKVDFVVMGHRGSGESRAHLGRFTRNMVAHSPVPVIAVPAGPGVREPGTILYPTDLEDLAGELHRIVPLAAAFNAGVHVLHISRDEVGDILTAHQRLQDIRGRADYEKISATVVQGGDVIQHINEHIRDNPVDMLALFHHDRGFFGRLFNDSVTVEMSHHHLRVPLMIFRKGQAA